MLLWAVRAMIFLIFFGGTVSAIFAIYAIKPWPWIIVVIVSAVSLLLAIVAESLLSAED